MKHPMQPLEKDRHGTIRFKRNAIVDFLAKNKLNELAEMDFNNEDWEQLAQLIGYSLNGFSDLSYVNDETIETASIMYGKGQSEVEARIECLEKTLNAVRAGLKQIVPKVFKVHEDDLII